MERLDRDRTQAITDLQSAQTVAAHNVQEISHLRSDLGRLSSALDHSQTHSSSLRSQLHTLETQIQSRNTALTTLNAQNTVLKDSLHRSRKDNRNSTRRADRSETTRNTAKALAKDSSTRLQKAHSWLVKSKGAYIPRYKELVLSFVSMGMAQRHVGRAIAEVGRAMGVHVSHCIDRKSIERAIDEIGVVVDIQLGYELNNAPGKHILLLLHYLTKLI